MAGDLLNTTDYWTNFQVTRQDVEFLHNYLFDHETPLTPRELVTVLIVERVRIEKLASQAKRQANSKTYLPKESFQIGDELVFPSLNWKHGVVKAERTGVNPEIGKFDVLTVGMDDGTERLFASGLALHALNDQPVTPEEDEVDSEEVVQAFGGNIEKKIEAAFKEDGQLVRIAGRWFPRALLVDVNVGNLNLAEAVLDMSGGEPLPASALLKDVSLPDGVNPKLAEFSLNFALQEDERFDEVGPAGQVLWCLRRLEPAEVREAPLYLRYSPIEYDRSLLSDQMLKLESQLDDELSDIDATKPDSNPNEVIISLVYPHLRAGTLPISARVRSMFPTAYESPRVRFTLVDGKTKQKMPAWVVREYGYVYGLRDWYKANELMPGSLVRIRRSETLGEVIIEAKSYRAKDWVRTVIVGTDGGMVFAMLKQSISAEFNDRMSFAIPSYDTLDQLWKQDKKQPFEKLVADMIREMSKLTPQGHVHAQELYSAVNIVRRVPPGPLFALLSSRPEFSHVGDLHFRLSDSE